MPESTPQPMRGEEPTPKLAFELGWLAARAYHRSQEPSEAEIARLRGGLEAALGASFTVGLLRKRAQDQRDAELEKWGERLKEQLVAIREVLSPGTAAFMAEQRAHEDRLAALRAAKQGGSVG